MKPALLRQIDVINPATETPAGSISLGSEIRGVDGAVAAARRAFESYSQVSLAERMALLARIIEQYERRIPEIAEAVTAEMGSPAGFARSFHASAPISVLKQMIEILPDLRVRAAARNDLLVREPIGVCGLDNTLERARSGSDGEDGAGARCRLYRGGEAIRSGTAELHHSRRSASQRWVPKGVLNLVNGDGATVGQRIAANS